MSSQGILKTKLYMPPTRPELVSRPHLIERLNEGLHRKLALISAPAGYGKTMLVSEWVRSDNPKDNQIENRVGWLSLDESENAPACFLTYFVAALNQAFSGTTWNRCRVHFMRNLLAHIPKGNKAMVAVALRTIFTQSDRPAAGQQLVAVVQAMRPRWPKAAELLERAEEDILAFMAFPIEHWSRIYSTNPLERLNKEIKRRTNVVGIFPDQASVIRLVGSILIEISDEWQIGRRYFGRESMKKVVEPESLLVTDQAPFCLAPVH